METQSVTWRNMQNNLLKVSEVAQRLGIKEGTVRLWLSMRKLPRVQCGRSVRVPAEAVDQFIERNTIPAREL
jgi:excisionase family DNA binding protein